MCVQGPLGAPVSWEMAQQWGSSRRDCGLGVCGRDEDSQCSLPGQTLGHTAIHSPPSRAERFVTKSVSLSRETSGLASQLFPPQELQVAGSRCQLTRGPQKQQREVNI